MHASDLWPLAGQPCKVSCDLHTIARAHNRTFLVAHRRDPANDTGQFSGGDTTKLPPCATDFWLRSSTTRTDLARGLYHRHPNGFARSKQRPLPMRPARPGQGRLHYYNSILSATRLFRRSRRGMFGPLSLGTFLQHRWRKQSRNLRWKLR